MMIPALYTSLGLWTVQTYTLIVGVAIVAATARTLWMQPPPERRAWADVLLGGLLGGLLGARLLHVLLNADYFADHTQEALQLAAGGLNWHGAVVGGLLGIGGVARLRVPQRDLRPLFHALAWALPLLTLGGWYGCLSAGCGTGYEVDTLAYYPAWMAIEYADVYGMIAPRLFTPAFGMALGLVALLWVALLRRHPQRFALTLALIGAGMFGIGIFRADRVPLWFGLRADQVLDALTVALSLTWAVHHAKGKRV